MDKNFEQESGEFTPIDEMVISDLDTLKVVADPFRMSILQYLHDPGTVKRVAKKLGPPTNSVPLQPAGSTASSRWWKRGWFRASSKNTTSASQILPGAAGLIRPGQGRDSTWFYRAYSAT
jgi:hypothetical protein